MLVFDPELAAKMKMPKELLERAKELHLTIHIGIDRVHASVFDFNSSSCFWHVHSDLPLGLEPYQFIYQRNWMEAVFRKCSITFDTDTYSLVPQSLFDPSLCADYLQMQHGVMSNAPAYTELSEAQAVLCFEGPDWQNDIIRLIPNARVMPLGALLTRLAIIKAQSDDVGFILAVSSGMVTMAGWKNKNLVLLATHDARTPEDVLYHTSNAALRLQIDMETCHAELLQTIPDDEMGKLLGRYLKVCAPLSLPVIADAPAITQLHYLCA